MLGAPRANAKCPCHSGLTFADCCAPYLNSKACPWRPEALMRSRYTAYTLAKISYIRATQVGPAAESFDSKTAIQWAKSCNWRGLCVDLDQSTAEFWQQDSAYVVFTAKFKQGDEFKQMHERSLFKRIAGKWYYYYAPIE